MWRSGLTQVGCFMTYLTINHDRDLKEDAMNIISKTTFIFVSAAFSICATVSFVTPARAANSMLEKCQKGSSRARVEGCCNSYVRENGKPLWMQEVSSSCSQVVQCWKNSDGFPECYIHIPPNNNQGSTTPETNDQPVTIESDTRLKHNILRVGTTVLGLGLYDFEYNDRTGVFEGVMAQEVLRVMPDAVIVGPNGFYRVNYGMLGIAMKRLH
jgi:Chaperone of endosialidase